MKLDQLMTDVRLFHHTFGHPIGQEPTLLSEECASRRADWLEEEARELREAKTIYEQADAFIDSIYFAIGGLVELGINPSPLWDLVQQANMAKVWPDGSVRHTEIGKVIKPPEWRAPDEAIAEEINLQIAEARGWRK